MKAPQAGFTLVEMVVALTLAALVAGFAAMLINTPLTLYQAETTRAELAARAGDAWPQIRDELRAALPNSVRTRRNGQFVALEMLAAVDWVRYHGPLGATISAAGRFRGVPLPYNGSGYLLAVNNLGTPGADAYAMTGVMTPAGTVLGLAAGPAPGETRITLTPAPTFAADSARHRAYLVTGPVSYLCDESSGTVTRYSAYSPAASHAARDTPTELMGAGAVPAQVAAGVTRCDFAVDGGGTQAAQLVTARLQASDATGSVQFVNQARLEFLP